MNINIIYEDILEDLFKLELIGSHVVENSAEAFVGIVSEFNNHIERFPSLWRGIYIHWDQTDEYIQKDSVQDLGYSWSTSISSAKDFFHDEDCFSNFLLRGEGLRGINLTKLIYSINDDFNSHLDLLDELSLDELNCIQDDVICLHERFDDLFDEIKRFLKKEKEVIVIDTQIKIKEVNNNMVTCLVA